MSTYGRISADQVRGWETKSYHPVMDELQYGCSQKNSASAGNVYIHNIRSFITSFTNGLFSLVTHCSYILAEALD